MSTGKFETEKFTGKNDFGLWRLKMKAVMMQHGLWEILKDGKDPAGKDPQAKGGQMRRSISRPESSRIRPIAL